MRESLELQEKPKAVSVERLEDGSISIELSDELQKKDGTIFNVAAIAQSVIGVGLFEVIVNVENGSLEIQSHNPTQEVPEEIKVKIEEELAKINNIF